jgi:hypothetical protein
VPQRTDAKPLERNGSLLLQPQYVQYYFEIEKIKCMHIA